VQSNSIQEKPEPPALGELKRAADSLGVTASQEGSSLKMLSGPYGLRLSQENGEMKWTNYYRRVPAWVFSMGSAVVILAFGFSALTNPNNGWNTLLMFFALFGVLTEMDSRARFQRLQERLVDRAYALGSSATV
jgi:hypothetical protein